MSHRKVIRLAGETGFGLSGVGESIQKALKKIGFYIRSEREFPSTIKGGLATNNINFSSSQIHGLSNVYDIGVGLDREGLKDLLGSVKKGGIVIHGFDRWPKVIKELPQIVQERELKMFTIPAREIALSAGGSLIMVNTVLIGFLWKVLGLDTNIFLEQIQAQFETKPQFIEVNKACFMAGYDFIPEEGLLDASVDFSLPTTKPETILIDGNTSLALGAVAGGVRAYFAYPMSPSTSILVYLAQIAQDTNMLVRQVEDEITAVQMTLGSMHAGTRALVATSGGGFDLMTETVSLSAMIETPLVVVIVQRPGPATGLPTWTGQADLNLAIHSGHGEYAKIVLAVSNPSDAFILIQKAFNLAETFQVPVIVLSEATIAMSWASVPTFKDEDVLELERGLVTGEDLDGLSSTDRYSDTETGVSKRWLPGSSKAVYFANGDEHWESGEVTEDAGHAKTMIDKRLKKSQAILETLPEPEMLGDASAQITIVGWGSTKGSVLDTIEILSQQGIKVNYLHYSYVWPLKVGTLQNLIKNNQKLLLIEGNAQAQLGNMLQSSCHFEFNARLLKYNGRPFFVEEVVEFVKENL